MEGSSRKDEEYATDDESVLRCIRTNNLHNAGRIVHVFFNIAKSYSLQYWQPKYPILEDYEWDVIIANANLKLITRIKNGWQKKENVQLTTYYTSVVGYAILDYLQDKKKGPQLEVNERDAVIEASVEGALNEKERTKQIHDTLKAIVDNDDQLTVLLLYAEGYSYKEIMEQCNYQSEGACRNAFVKAKKKISDYLVKHPEQAKRLKRLLMDAD